MPLLLVGWLSQGNGWCGLCDANPPYFFKMMAGVSQVEPHSLRSGAGAEEPDLRVCVFDPHFDPHLATKLPIRL